MIVKEQKRVTRLATLKNWNKSPTTGLPQFPYTRDLCGCRDWCGCHDLCGFVTGMIVVTSVWVVTGVDGRDWFCDVTGADDVTGVLM